MTTGNGQPRHGDRIDQLWAFVQVDPSDDNEGIIARLEPNTQMWVPLFGADSERIASERPYAEMVAKVTGIPVRLVRFETRVELEVLEP